MPPRAHPQQALAVYAESLAVGRRVVLFAEPDTGLLERLDELGAATVVLVSPGDELEELRGARFDLAIVANLADYGAPAALLAQVRRLVGETGAVLVATPHLDPDEGAGEGRLDYYALFDLVAREFADVRMIAQLPFHGVALAEVGDESGSPAVSVDTQLADADRAPEAYIALGSQRGTRLDAYAIVELPAPQAPRLEARSDTRAFDEARQQVDEVRARYDEVRQRLAETGAQLDRAHADQLESRVQLDERALALQASRSQLDERTAALHAARTQLDERTATLHATRTQLDERTASLHAAKAQLDERTASLHAVKAQLDERNASLHAAKAQLDERNASLHAAKAQLDERNGALQATRGTVTRAVELERELAARGRQLEDLSSEVEEMRSAAEAGRIAAAQVEELAKRADRAERARAQVEPELARVVEAHAAELLAFEERLRERAQAVRALEVEVARRERMVRELISAIDEHAERPAAAHSPEPAHAAAPMLIPEGPSAAEAALTDENVQLHRRLDVLAAEMARREGQEHASAWTIAELERRLSEATRAQAPAPVPPPAEPARDDARRPELDARFAEALDELDALRSALAQEHAARQRAESGEELVRAREELARRASLLEELGQKLAAMGAAPGPQVAT